MFKDKNRLIFYIISLVFIAINITLITIDVYYFSFLPIILLFVLASFISLDKVLLSIVFLTPLSIQLIDIFPGLSINMALPTEPLLAGVLLLFVFKLLLNNQLNRKILLHPVSITIYINLFWILITSLTSTMPLVSLKFLLSRLWFVIGAYFLMIEIFRKQKNINKFIGLYTVALGIVIIYTNIRLLSYGLNNQSASNWVVQPFFNDHTSYGAMLVMFVFPLVFFMLKKTDDLFEKTLVYLFFGLFVFGIILSYTRAAWLSLFASLMLWVVIKLKIKIKTILIVCLVFVVSFLTLQRVIIDNLEENEAESSGKFSEHIESMINISSDASNVERINRWKCAIRMFAEKPLFGWGPGTYNFNYAPFQKYQDLSTISTNFGDLGNAHSEYLGALSESGLLGMLSFMLVVFMAFRTAYLVYHNTSNKSIKQFTLFIVLGLTTYFIHAFLNNFLDTDKASIPVWGFMAILVALDIYHKNNNEDTLSYNDKE